jgi:2-methylcitrate dehydratase PrpD
VDVRATGDWITGMSPFLAPRTAEEARFSGNFSIAVALLDGKAGLDQYRKERIHSPDVQEMMQRIRISELEGSDELTRRIHETGDVTKSGLGELTIKLRDGREFTTSGEQPRGSGQLPLKRQDLIEKYRDCGNRALPDVDVGRSIEIIESLENQADISELMGLLIGRQE